jgi:hypothetical protein
MSIPTDLQVGPRGDSRTATVALSARRKRVLAFFAFLALSTVLVAQKPTGGGTANSSPDNPQPQQQTSSGAIAGVASGIGYVTQKSWFFPDIATSPEPLTTPGKFELFLNESVSPANLLTSAIGASYSQARNNPEAYGQGWDAYGGRFGASLARSASNNFFSDFVFASIFRQDPRFFPESKPTFWGSVKYSAERIVITRNDSGKDVFNTSGVLGPLAGEALANVYLPQSEQTVGKTAERYAVDLAWQVGGNMFRNYWPTFFKRMGLNRLKVIPNPGESGAPTK